MGLFKRKREPDAEHDAGQPTFVFEEVQPNGCVYETYRAADAEMAKAFLLTKQVDRELYYIVVETPDGNWGTDIHGLYLENLRPWQLDPGAAQHIGQIHSVQNVFGVATAARGIVDNFVARVQCGGCGQLWYDGLRYQDYTLVRCPQCQARNSVDSSGITVSVQPDGQVAVTMGAHINAEQSGDPADPATLLAVVDQAVTAARDGVDAVPPGHPHRPGRLFNLGNALEERFKRSGDPDDLDAAIAAYSEAADTAVLEDSSLPDLLAAVSRMLMIRFEAGGSRTDLDAAISTLRDALAVTPPTHPDRHGMLSAVGLLLRDRFELTGGLDDLEDAVAAARGAVDGAPADHVAYPQYLANLSATLRVRFEHVGQHDDLDAAVVAGRAAVAAAGTDHPVSFIGPPILALALQERFTAVGDLADLEEAIAAVRGVVAAVTLEDPNYPRLHHNLGRALLARFQRLGRVTDIEDAVATARVAAETGGTSTEPSRARYFSLFGDALLTRFGRTDDLHDLDGGIAAHRQAVAATPPGHSDHALHLAGFASALLTRFRRTGQPDGLTEAVDAAREALNGTASTHADRPRYLNILGIALHNRFEHSGDQADLDEAIAVGREAVAGTSPGHTRYAAHLSCLGSACHTRFLYAGHLADLDEAITVLRDALTATPPDHPDHQAIAHNFSSVLVERFQLVNHADDLDEAIAIRREVVAGTPLDHPLHSVYSHGLSYALRIRYQDTGQPGDLEEAMAIGRRAVDGIPPDDPGFADALLNIAMILLSKFERTREAPYLDDAVTAARRAIGTTSPERPDRAEHLSVLGTVLWTRFEHAGQSSDLDDAIAAFIDSVHVESGPPEIRMVSARLWGRAAIQAGQADSAVDGFAAAVRLLQRFVWHGLPRATREERVVKCSGLAADAAACAIRAGRPEQAVELLEAGRSVLWGQLLNLRTDLTELAEREPALAARLDQIRTLLDTPLPATSAAVAGPDSIETLHAEQNRVAEERMRLAREFDDLVGRIRAVDGFEHFLEATSFTQLRAAASAGPVAIVNTSRHGCHALLVSDTDVQVVDLPGLTHQKVVTQANALVGILTRATGSNRPFLERERDRHTILDILAWLWDKIAEPVLTRLGYTGPPAPGEAWPRMWWCPTGRLALLPLHAAGHYPRHKAEVAGHRHSARSSDFLLHVNPYGFATGSCDACVHRKTCPAGRRHAHHPGSRCLAGRARRVGPDPCPLPDRHSLAGRRQRADHCPGSGRAFPARVGAPVLPRQSAFPRSHGKRVLAHRRAAAHRRPDSERSRTPGNWRSCQPARPRQVT
ncbi:hypothetical protein [Kibdelosporangium aridum]|uniref:hypothetical protein n=1 Tax=Kibdelosporangium aridum TaxID=2030 RepID=UPI00406BBB4F